MNRFTLRYLATILFAALAAPTLFAGTIRTVDFESPPPYANSYTQFWEAYSGYEATFEYGIRVGPRTGQTTSTMYWGQPGLCRNCEYDPIRIFFSKPVKNVQFTLLDLGSVVYAGPIHWDSREFFEDNPRSGMSLTTGMAIGDARVITIPAQDIRYLDINTGNGVAIDNFSFEVEDDAQTPFGSLTMDGSYALELQALAGYTASEAPKQVSIAAATPSQTIRVPLGLPFTWGMLKADKVTAVPATYALLTSTFDPNYPVADDASQYPNRTVSLFPDSVLLGFNLTAVTASKSFVGLHVGTQFFQVTPTDPSIKPALIRVDVVKPTTLGAYPPFDLDDDISKVASRRGIPPQWIKGQADKESDKIGIGKNFHWDRTTFRYEPLSADLDYISRCSGCKPDREIPPFSRYRFATQSNDGGLPVGSDLSTDDIHFRTRLRDGDGKTLLNDTQPDVTARAIFDGNDPAMNWSTLNPSKYAMVENDWLQNGKDDLAFNAQTALASSYGLLQCMPSSAERKANWRDPFGPGTADIHPSYLVDTPNNLASPAGSLNVATVQLLYHLTTAAAGNATQWGLAAFPIDHFDSFKDFAKAWQAALKLYNFGEKKYATDVMSRAMHYAPSLASAGIQP